MTIENRYDFAVLFDVTNGNPNGDPDSNLPRTNPVTRTGLVTDVCLKRKIRNYIQLTQLDLSRFDIFIKQKSILNTAMEDAAKQSSVDKKDIDKRKQYLCNKYFDIRSFGAVLNTGDYKAGQVQGPVQLTYSESIDPIESLNHTITRCCVTTQKESDAQDGANQTMGSKTIVPYGLYKGYGFINANLTHTGFDDTDLNLLWEAIMNMFEYDRSASRGLMTVRGLYIWKHNNKLGCCSSNKLFETLTVKKHVNGCAKSFNDYTIEVDNNNLPEGVELIVKR